MTRRTRDQEREDQAKVEGLVDEYHLNSEDPTAEELAQKADAYVKLLFHNYKPPRRLLALEIIVIILLTMLLLINPNGFTAISMKGTDTVGLLSSCSGGTCTSWLGAPAGGSTTATAAPAPVAPAEKRAPSDSTSTSTTTSSPTTFHLQTGLAAFCTFILLLYAFAFHLLRLRTPPPREGTDSGLKDRKSWLRRKLHIKWDLSGLKRYGYRVSRLFIGADVVLLLCVCISAGVQASSGGFNTGFVLLVIAWILLFLVALIEFLDESRKIRGWLMFKEGWGRRKDKEATKEDEESIEETAREPSRGRNRTPK